MVLSRCGSGKVRAQDEAEPRRVFGPCLGDLPDPEARSGATRRRVLAAAGAVVAVFEEKWDLVHRMIDRLLAEHERHSPRLPRDPRGAGAPAGRRACRHTPPGVELYQQHASPGADPRSFPSCTAISWRTLDARGPAMAPGAPERPAVWAKKGPLSLASQGGAACLVGSRGDEFPTGSVPVVSVPCATTQKECTPGGPPLAARPWCV